MISTSSVFDEPSIFYIFWIPTFSQHDLLNMLSINMLILFDYYLNIYFEKIMYPHLPTYS